MTLRFQKGICLDGLVSLSPRKKKGDKWAKTPVKAGIKWQIMRIIVSKLRKNDGNTLKNAYNLSIFRWF